MRTTASYSNATISMPSMWQPLTIGTPKPVIEAMLAGKDIYCEKPLTLTIDEGKLIRKVQKETGRVVQVGTQQRSTFNLFVKAMAMVAEGRVGKIQRVQAAIGGAPHQPADPNRFDTRGFELGPLAGPCPEGSLSTLAAQKWPRTWQLQLPL